jgi:hypothetical protein
LVFLSNQQNHVNPSFCAIILVAGCHKSVWSMKSSTTSKCRIYHWCKADYAIKNYNKAIAKGFWKSWIKSDFYFAFIQSSTNFWNLRIEQNIHF